MNLLEAGNQPPGHGEEHIRDIIWLSDNCKPSVDHYTITCIGFYSLGILNGLPWNLRKSVALDELTFFLVAECVLLAIGTIPHPVHEKIYNCKQC